MHVPTTAVALFAAAALAAPASSPDDNNNNNNVCTSQSSKVTQFQVKDFDFHASWTFSTPAHQIAGGYVNFTLANAAVDYEYQCSAASGQLSDFFYGNMAYDCIDAATGQRTQRGTFSFSRPAATLAINQTWDCPEGSRFWAEGSAVLDLRCQDTTYQNPNWTMGQIYSNRVVTCDKLSQPVPITSLRAAA